MDSQPASPADPAPPAQTAALVARVVAWHNRHPLARRITPEQVQGVGVVALPFSPQGRRQTLRPAIGEAFLPRPLQWAATRFAARFAVIARPGDSDWPQRDIQPSAKRLGPEGSTQWRYLATAAIEVGDQRRRVLLSPAPDGAALGQHLWHWPRLLASLAAAVTAAGLVATLWQVAGRAAPGAPAAHDVVAAHRPTASAVAAASAVVAVTASADVAPTDGHAAAAAPPTGSSAPSHTAASASTSASAPVVAVAVAAHAPVAANAAAPTPPEAASGTPTDIRPRLDDAAVRAGRLELAEARARRAASVLVQHQDMQAFALVSAPRRSRDEAESAAVALRDALSRADLGTAARVEAVAAGGQWRVVWWPFLTADDAQDAQARLRRDGVVLGLVAF